MKKQIERGESRPRTRKVFQEVPSVLVRGVELLVDDDVQRHREKLARVVLDEMYQFVALLDAEGTMLEANRNALEGAGILLEDIRGKSFWNCRWWTVSGETQQTQREAVRRAAAGEFVRYDVEIYGTASGEETIIIDYSLIPVRDRMGRVVLLLAEGRNITEKKRAEGEIARKNQELQRLLDRVRELDEMKSRFFANVSHELRTPLALILGPAERMLGEGSDLSETQRRDLEIMRRNAATLLKHVNDLLDLSKLDAGQMTPRYEVADMALLVRQVSSHFGALAPHREVSWVVDTPDTLVAEVDASKIERLVLNLLSNAFKFTPRGGRILCSLRAVGERALISVQDSGPGIPAETRETIFERFRQVEHHDTREHGGTGLGLSIARDFVDLHGGSITVTDAPGGGALFKTEIPLRAPEGARVHERRDAADARDEDLGAGSVLEGTLYELAASAPEQGAPVERVAADGAERPLVLVVEDHPDLRRFIVEALADEYRVVLARNGEEGLERAVTLAPDLIVSDIMMPRMSGDRMVREIRAHSDLADTPIMVLSAKADDALRLRLLNEGVQDYLVKPFAAEELRARVRNLVMIKRTRDVLRRELSSQKADIEALAQEIADRNRDLRSVTEEMRLARNQAEAASLAKSEFLRLVSHELRSPLTAMTLLVDRLREVRGAEPAPKEEWIIDRIGQSVGRLTRMVEGLLEHSRLRSGGVALDVRSGDALALARETVDELLPRAAAKQLRLDIGAGSTPATVTTDLAMLRIVLGNLIDNAIKHTETGGVTVRVQGRDGAVELAVEDTGIGIPASEQVRVFDPFVQLEPVPHKHGHGVGLGLAIVRDIVTRLGGTITLRSEPGSGSVFTVVVPSAAAGGASA